MFPARRRKPRWEMSPRGTQSEFDRLFDQMLSEWWGDGGQPVTETAAYPVDIREDEQSIYVEAELPGFNKDEIEVSLEQGVLSISAEHRAEQEDKEEKGRTHLRERSYRRIERSFTLPTKVDESDVDARLEEGVLHLTLKKTQSEQPRKISIK